MGSFSTQYVYIHADLQSTAHSCRLLVAIVLNRIPDALLYFPNFQGRVGKALLLGIGERQDGNALDPLCRNAARNTEEDIFLNAVQTTDTGGNGENGASVVQDGLGNVGTRKA